MNFAVYVNDGVTGNWITDLGLTGVNLLASDPSVEGLSARPFGTERNVFFGQITRSDAATPSTITTLDWAVSSNPWMRIGSIDDTVFFDNTDSAAVIGGNPATAAQSLGANATNGTTGKTTGVVAPAFASNSSAIEPGTGTLSFAFGVATFNFGTPIAAGGHSSIVFLTNHSEPLSDVATSVTLFKSGGINGGISFDVPVANPEPGSLVLLSFAGIGGAGLAWRRRRKDKKQRDDGNGSVSIA
jgi:hypothetical protein